MTRWLPDVESYYRLHSRFYDVTRWAFLFGRGDLLDHVRERIVPERVLEVGCGTGTNLRRLAELFSNARLTGVDLSPEMLGKAERKMSPWSDRVRLIRGAFPTVPEKEEHFDLVLFSYSLSMIHPGWKEAIAAAFSRLREGGCVAVVDFQDTPLHWFYRWMELNHVQLGGYLLKELQSRAPGGDTRVNKAFLGTWRYFTFLS